MARDSFGSLLRTLDLTRDELRLFHYIDVSMADLWSINVTSRILFTALIK